MNLPINLPEDVAPIDNLDPEIETPETSVYLETMFRALEEPTGMAVETDSRKNAQALRHRFYRARQQAIASGNRALDSITISIVFVNPRWELHIKKLPFTVRPL